MDDRTVIRPMPGGRRPRSTQERPVPRPAVSTARPAAPEPPAAAILSGSGEENPVLKLVTPLMSFVGKIQHTREHPNLEEFHRYALDQIRYYASCNWGLSQGGDEGFYVSYALCSLIDEVVLNTPWGSTSDWGSDSLLINFHQEAWGGEKFFIYLEELRRRPAANLLVLQVYYACLALGFEGQYRQQAGGHRELSALTSDLYTQIRLQSDEELPPLSPAWEGVRDQRHALVRHVPLWVIAACLMVGLLVGFLGFSWQINQNSDQLLRTLIPIAQEPLLAVTPFNIDRLAAPAARVHEPDLQRQRPDLLARLEPALQTEIADGVVELLDDPDRTLIRLRHAGLFPSGQAQLADAFAPLISRIGTLLQGLESPILVTGHSDNVPIFSARFPSNWALSKARADSVGQLLSAQLQPGARVDAEGMADLEPLVPNDSPANRALNRRVEIVLRKY